VSPIKPIGPHRYKQIDASKPRVPAGWAGRMPKQIDLGRIGSAGFIDRNQIIAADVPIGKRCSCRGLDRTGDSQQVATGPRPLNYDNLREPIGGAIGIKVKR